MLELLLASALAVAALQPAAAASPADEITAEVERGTKVSRSEACS